MNVHPIDIPSLLGTVIWPLTVVVAFAVFRRPLGELVSVLGRRTRKFSFAGVALELAEVSEVKSQSLEAETRQLDAASPQSKSSAISGLLNELRSGKQHDFIVIDLGSKSSPRWLTSRLYLLVFLIAPIHRPNCLVFVETVGSVRKKFVGTASPDRVRWALARRYSWLEWASAEANWSVGGLQFDPATGYLADWQIPQFMERFLVNIRPPPPVLAPLSPQPSNNPVITSLSPSEGSAGTSVTISGYTLGSPQGPTSTVTFNGIPATITTRSDTQIAVKVPTGDTTGNVIVTVSGLPSNGIPFNAPVIVSLHPSEAFVGTPVTISGYRFGDSQRPTSTVTFNGILATVASWSNTQIAVTVPKGATTGDVKVTVSGLASNNMPFTVGTADSAEWVLLPSGEHEHAKWLSGQRIENLLGSDLTTRYLTLPNNQTMNDLRTSVLRSEGSLIAIVDPDKTFRGLVDRSTLLENLANEFSKQSVQTDHTLL